MGVMLMLKRNCTYHISEERVDRACYIMQTIGIGEVIKEVRCVQEDGRVSWQCLTNTGVILVLSEDKKICITLYIASQPKVSAMYQGKTPSWVMNDVAVEVRAFTYKGARTKALNLGQEMVRKWDESDVCAFMRVCKL